LFIQPNGVARFSVVLIILVAAFFTILTAIAPKFKSNDEGGNAK